MITQLPTTNIAKIEYYLSLSGIKYVLEDGEFNVSEYYGLNCWIIPRLEFDYVLTKMTAKIKNRRRDEEARIFQYVNYLNRNYLPNAYYYEDGKLFGEYYTLGSITNSRTQFYDTLNFCVGTFKDAIQSDDRYNLISFS